MELLVSAVVSLVVQLLKKFADVKGLPVVVMLAAASFVGASVMYGLQGFGLWDEFLKVATQAAGIYGLLAANYNPNKE